MNWALSTFSIEDKIIFFSEINLKKELFEGLENKNIGNF
jgi:hypothetical protein